MLHLLYLLEQDGRYAQTNKLATAARTYTPRSPAPPIPFYARQFSPEKLTAQEQKQQARETVGTNYSAVLPLLFPGNQTTPSGRAMQSKQTSLPPGQFYVAALPEANPGPLSHLKGALPSKPVQSVHTTVPEAYKR